MATSSIGFKSTIESANSDVREDRPCRLLELPTELRLMIWEHLFASMAKYTNQNQLIHLNAIIYANKGIFYETAPVLIKYHRAVLERLWNQLHRAQYPRNPRKHPQSMKVTKKLSGCWGWLNLAHKIYSAIDRRMATGDASDTEKETGEDLNEG